MAIVCFRERDLLNWQTSTKHHHNRCSGNNTTNISIFLNFHSTKTRPSKAIWQNQKSLQHPEKGKKPAVPSAAHSWRNALGESTRYLMLMQRTQVRFQPPLQVARTHLKMQFQETRCPFLASADATHIWYTQRQVGVDKYASTNYVCEGVDWLWWYMSLIAALRRHISQFKASLVYKVKSKSSRPTL